MAVTVQASGTQASTIGTEHVLAAITVAGVFVLEVDTAVMLAGDVIELRIKNAPLAAGTLRTAFYAMFAGVQPADDALKASVPFTHDGTSTGPTVTLRQTLGVSRSYPWVIKRIA